MVKRKKKVAQPTTDGSTAVKHATSEAAVEVPLAAAEPPSAGTAVTASAAKRKKRRKQSSEPTVAGTAGSTTVGAAAPSARPAGAPAAGSGAANATQRAASADIDDIFAKRRSRPVAAAAAGKPATPPAAQGRSTAGSASKSRGRTTQPKCGSAEDPLGRGDAWVDDGLGGVYNNEGWTGRHTSGDKLRIFKTHLLKVGDGGGTPLCPFECECCF